jgi:hypothetical protein
MAPLLVLGLALHECEMIYLKIYRTDFLLYFNTGKIEPLTRTSKFLVFQK